MTILKAALCAGVAAVALAAPLAAAEIEAQSRISGVTVYPDAAIVTRVLDVDLPAGESVLVFKGLPLGIDPNSLRVEGKTNGQLALGSVEARVRPSDPQKIVSESEAQLKPLREERDRIAAALDALEGRKAMIQRFGQAGPERGERAAPLDIGQWTAAWDAVGAGLAKVNDELRVVREQQRSVEARIKAIEAAEITRRARTAPEREFTVAVEAAGAVKGRLSVSYRVAGASWQPAYDARLVTGDGGKAAGMTLVRRAMVTQRTGEDWGGVELTLSTVRAARGTQAPEVQPERVAFFEIPVVMAAPAPRAVPMAADAMVRSKAAEMAQRSEAGAAPQEQRLAAAEAALETNGFQAQYRLPGTLTVPGDGTQKSFVIQSRSLVPELVIKTAPALDPTAYLEAAFENQEEAPLLGGPVNLVRDDAFVGRGRIAFTPAGGKLSLGFGADDRVTVSRVPVRRRETEPVLLGSTKSDTREFKISVRNLHDFAIKAVVVDQLPYSEAANLQVEPLATNTPATEKTVQDRRGVMSWSFDLKPREEKEIRLGYRMRWPSDREIVFDRVPVPR